MKNKGYIVLLDSLVALILVLIVATALFSIEYSGTARTESVGFTKLHYVSEDVLDVLNKKEILDEIATLWSENSTPGSPQMVNASNLTREYIEKIIPNRFGYRLIIENEEVVNSSGNSNRIAEEKASTKTHSTRLLVGYGKGLPTRGLVARAFLSKIREKTTSRFAYFGGFVGQGNISREMFLPDNITIQEVYMEMNVGDNFTLFINGNQCNGLFTPAADGMAANIKAPLPVACESLIDRRGANNPNIFELRFTGDDISKQYIGGGFIEVKYNTSEMDTALETGTMRFYFPEINGIINYYSSFYVPGWVDQMFLNISFRNNFTTSMYIGDKLIFSVNGSNSTQTITNTSAQLLGLLSSSAVSEKTVPIRIGSGNISYNATRGYGDVILITDLSGSMRWRIGYNDSTNGTQRNCGDSKLYDNDTRRISLAKCLDKDFVDTVLNTTGNRVGLVGFTTNADIYHNLSDNKTSLIDHINNYSDLPSGGTCICCAINKAIQLLGTSTPSREKYIIVMTDGITGYHCGNCTYSVPCNCSGICNNTTGVYECNGTPSDCNGAQCDTAINDSICGAERAHSLLDATVHPIGFGPVSTGCPNANRTLKGIANCGNGSYYGSQNASELADIYSSIAEEIVNASHYSQITTLTDSGMGNVTNATLYGYPESYIEFTYTPINTSYYGRITITRKSDRFNDPINCVGHVLIPENVNVSEMKVTSYSAEFWTDYLNINNLPQPPYRLWTQYPGVPYISLGDPYIVNIPDSEVVVKAGEYNNITIETGNSETERTNCSADDRAIYTMRIKSFTGYGDVYPSSEGCIWDIEFEDGSSMNDTAIPTAYAGDNNCSYTSSLIGGYEDDAINDAAYRLLSGLDLYNNGKIDVIFDSTAVEFKTISSGGVRSLWGPVAIKLIVWV